MRSLTSRAFLLKAATLIAGTVFIGALAGCHSSGASEGEGTPTSFPIGMFKCRFPPPQQVEVEGNFYEPLWWPIRSGLVNMDALSLTQLEAHDNRECTSVLPASIYEIAGVPVEQMFVEVQETKSSGGNESTPLACGHSNGVYTFTAVGSEESPPPFSREKGPPWSEGSPTPVPTPPLDGPLVELSEEGLLEAGWPVIHLMAPDGRRVTWDNGVRVLYQGKEYRLSSYRPLDGESPMSLPIELLEKVDLILVRYSEDRWPAALAKSMPHILRSGEVEDRVMIYRPRDRSPDDVIIVDPCPTYPVNLQPDNIVFWGRVHADPIEPTPSPTPDIR